MAFPFLFEATFEQGTNGEWDSETDAGSALDFPHASELARYPYASAHPYRGAYAMRVQQPTGTGTADAVVIEGDIDIAYATTRWFRWYMNILPDNTATAADTLQLLELQSAAGTETWAVVGLRVTSGNTNIEIGVGRSVPTVWATYTGISATNRWTAVEVQASMGVDFTSADGSVTLYLDGQQVATVGSLVQGTAIGRGVFGIFDQLLTTRLTILFDEFCMDDTRIYPFVQSYPETMKITRSGHVFVGRGTVENITLISGATATDNQVIIFDTNRGVTNDASNIKVFLKNVTADEIIDPAGMPVDCFNGCYVALSGTEPSALVKISKPQAYSPASVRKWGLASQLNPAEVP